MFDFLKILKNVLLFILKKFLELLNFLCKMYSIGMRYDFDALEDNKKQDTKNEP